MAQNDTQLFDNPTPEFVKYPVLMERLGHSRRTVARRIADGTIKKLPGNLFYWPDVVEGLRNRKGAKKR